MKYTIEKLEKFWEIYIKNHKKPELMAKVIELFKDYLNRNNITELTTEELEQAQKSFMVEYKANPDLDLAIYMVAASAFKNLDWFNEVLEIVQYNEDYEKKKAEFMARSKFVPKENQEDQVIKYTKEQRILKYKDFLNDNKI